MQKYHCRCGKIIILQKASKLSPMTRAEGALRRFLCIVGKLVYKKKTPRRGAVKGAKNDHNKITLRERSEHCHSRERAYAGAYQL